MKAAVIHAYGSPDELKFDDMPDPSPGPGEVLIRTAATSINPLDVKMRSGAVKEYFPVSFPAKSQSQRTEIHVKQTVPGLFEKQVFSPCSDRALIDRFQPTWVNFERRADSPSCWKQ
jgi:hypothetical protein